MAPIRRWARRLGAGLLVLSLGKAASVQAQTADTGCADLVRQHDEAVRAAEGITTTAVEHALKAADPSGVLQRLGLGGGNLSPQDAVRRGALAAVPPPTQAAILIHLLRANTIMQSLAWKGCAPPGSSN